MENYKFEGIRFIPYSEETDFDVYIIEAESPEQAWEILYKWTEQWTWKSVELTEIDGEEVQKIGDQYFIMY